MHRHKHIIFGRPASQLALLSTASGNGVIAPGNGVTAPGNGAYPLALLSLHIQCKFLIVFNDVMNIQSLVSLY